MRTASGQQAKTPHIEPSNTPIQASARRDDRISQAVDEFLIAAEAGSVDRAALIEKYHDVADELAGCLDTFDFVNNVAPHLSEPAVHADSKASPTVSPLADLGDFRILREIGRGGMGVVYVQSSFPLDDEWR